MCKRGPILTKKSPRGPKSPLGDLIGIADDVKAGRKVSEGLYFTRGARIAIARKCLALWPLWKQTPVQQIEASEEELVEIKAS